MIKFNDGNAQVNEDGKYIHVCSVNEKEDLHIECSFLFASDISTEAKIISQYDLFVVGDISAKSIDVKGNLVCFGSVDAEDIVINGETYIRDELTVTKAQFGQDACLGGVSADEIISENMIFVKGVVNIDGEIRTEDNIICLEGIQGIGDVISSLTIAKEYIDVSNNKTANSIIIDEFETNASTPPQNIQSDIDYSEIFKYSQCLEDYDSIEYRILGRISTFKEELQKRITKSSVKKSYTAKNLIRDISSFAEFDSDYNKYYDSLSKMYTLSKAQNAKYVFDVLHLAAFFEHYDSLPDWIRKMKVIEQQKTNAITLYEENYMNIKYNIDNITDWSKCLSSITSHKSGFNELIYKKILDEMILKIGVKSRLIEKYYQL